MKSRHKNSHGHLKCRLKRPDVLPQPRGDRRPTASLTVANVHIGEPRVCKGRLKATLRLAYEGKKFHNTLKKNFHAPLGIGVPVWRSLGYPKRGPCSVSRYCQSHRHMLFLMSAARNWDGKCQGSAKLPGRGCPDSSRSQAVEQEASVARPSGAGALPFSRVGFESGDREQSLERPKPPFSHREHGHTDTYLEILCRFNV